MKINLPCLKTWGRREGETVLWETHGGTAMSTSCLQLVELVIIRSVVFVHVFDLVLDFKAKCFVFLSLIDFWVLKRSDEEDRISKWRRSISREHEIPFPGAVRLVGAGTG